MIGPLLNVPYSHPITVGMAYHSSPCLVVLIEEWDGKPRCVGWASELSSTTSGVSARESGL